MFPNMVKIPPYLLHFAFDFNSSQFCHWYLWRLSNSSSYVMIWYQFFTDLRIWYRFFTCGRIWYRFFTFVKIWYQFFQFENDRTRYSHIDNIKSEIWAQILHPKNYRNWPYVNFTFAKSAFSVPILHMMWNLRSVKFEYLKKNLIWHQAV